MEEVDTVVAVVDMTTVVSTAKKMPKRLAILGRKTSSDISLFGTLPLPYLQEDMEVDGVVSLQTRRF